MKKDLIEEARQRAAIGADVDPIDAARLLNELAGELESQLALAARQPRAANSEDDTARVKKIILESLVFTNENSDPWAQLLAENILAAVPDAATEDRDYWHGVATKAKDQRDAALAAVERVRAEASSVLLAETDPLNDWNRALDYLAKRIIAALDGAPEPESEWEERLAACEQHGTHCWTCARHKERRRPAGPWLPVEEEKP